MSVAERLVVASKEAESWQRWARDLEAFRVLTLGEIALLWGLEPRRASELVSKLESAGWVKRLSNRSDRRKPLFVLTRPGAEAAGLPFREVFPSRAPQYLHRNAVAFALIRAGIPRQTIEPVRQGDRRVSLPSSGTFSNPYPLAWLVTREDGRRVWVYTPETGAQVTRALKIVGSMPADRLWAHLVLLPDRRALSAVAREAMRSGPPSTRLHAVLADEAGEAGLSLYKGTEADLVGAFRAIRPQAEVVRDLEPPLDGVVALRTKTVMWVGDLRTGNVSIPAALAVRRLPPGQGILLLVKERRQAVVWGKRLVNVKSSVFFLDDAKVLYRLQPDGSVTEGRES